MPREGQKRKVERPEKFERKRGRARHAARSRRPHIMKILIILMSWERCHQATTEPRGTGQSEEEEKRMTGKQHASLQGSKREEKDSKNIIKFIDIYGELREGAKWGERDAGSTTARGGLRKGRDGEPRAVRSMKTNREKEENEILDMSFQFSWAVSGGVESNPGFY